VKRAGIRIDCVVGTSFGALAGSIYVTAPREDAVQRFRRLMNAYVAETKSDTMGGAVVGAAVLGAATGGLGWLLLGGVLGASTVNERDRNRFVHVLDQFYGGAAIESLPTRFVTLYDQRTSTGYRMVTIAKGNVATEVGNSAANPLIFQDLNPRTDMVLDPGLDRVAAIPVEDACKVFPRARLIAINVTDEPVFYSSAMKCPLLEVRVSTPPVGNEALLPGPTFDALVNAGFSQTWSAVAKAGVTSATESGLSLRPRVADADDGSPPPPLTPTTSAAGPLGVVALIGDRRAGVHSPPERRVRRSL